MSHPLFVENNICASWSAQTSPFWSVLKNYSFWSIPTQFSSPNTCPQLFYRSVYYRLHVLFCGNESGIDHRETRKYWQWCQVVCKECQRNKLQRFKGRSKSCRSGMFNVYALSHLRHSELIKYCYANQVQEVKPDVLLGLSAVGGLFSKEVWYDIFSICVRKPSLYIFVYNFIHCFA